MKDLVPKSGLQLIPGKQRFGILPSVKFWGGDFQAYDVVSGKFLFITSFIGMAACSIVICSLFGQGFFVTLVSYLLGYLLSFGIIEKIVRVKVAKRQALREAEAKKQLMSSS